MQVTFLRAVRVTTVQTHTHGPSWFAEQFSLKSSVACVGVKGLEDITVVRPH